MTALSEARQELAELEAQRMNLAAEVKAAADRLAPIEAKRTALEKRRAKHPVVMFLASEHVRGTLASLRVESYATSHTGALVGKKPKEVVDAIASGGVKVTTSGAIWQGTSYTARGLATRVVTPTPATLRAWDRATAARKRAEKALEDARAAEKAAAKTAFEIGATKVGFDALVADIAAAAVLTVAANAARDNTGNQGKINRLIDGQFGELTLMKRHVDHLAEKVELPDPPCVICQKRARENEQRDARITAIKQLGRRKFTCPTHGKVIGYAGRQRNLRFDDTIIEDCPVLYCPKDWTMYVDAKLLAADKAKAAKPAKVTKPAKVVSFVCPNPECEWEGESDVIDGMVTCDSCDVEYEVDRVKIVKRAA